MMAIISPGSDDSLWLSGSARLRMSGFKLPVSGADFVRPGDEVNVSFRWSVIRKTRPELAR